MKNILAKIHAIMSDLDYIRKDKTNHGQGYRYASEAAIKSAVHSALVKHRVVFQLSGGDPRHESHVLRTKSGESTILLTTVPCTYRFWDVDSGECLEGTMPGTGADNGDKGAYKAITGALKYALTSNLVIETGDDSEDAPDPAPVRRAEPGPKGVLDCPKCGKKHMGTYPTCYECYMKAKRNP
jgi:hypothetical protein